MAGTLRRSTGVSDAVRALPRARPWSSSTGLEYCGRVPPRTTGRGYDRGGPCARSEDHRAVPTRCLPSKASKATWPRRSARAPCSPSAPRSPWPYLRTSLLSQRLLDVLVLPGAFRSLLHSTWWHERPPRVGRYRNTRATVLQTATFESMPPRGTPSNSQTTKEGTVYIGGGLLALIIIILLLIWIF